MTFIIRSCPSACSYIVKSTPEDNQFLSGIRNLILHDSAYANDITISCDGKVFKTHKVLLALCSPYFKDIIAKNFTDYDKAVIILSQTSALCLDYILKFMYEGEVSIPGQYVHKFLETGATLKIRGLLNGEITFMTPAERREPEEAGSFHESIYDFQPETPGKHLIPSSKKRHSKKRSNKSSSSSKTTDVCTDDKPTGHKFRQEKSSKGTLSTNDILQQNSTPSGSRSGSGNHGQYLEPCEPITAQSGNKITENGKLAKNCLPQKDNAVINDSTTANHSLTQKIKLVQQDLSDFDSDSSGNILEDSDESSSDSDDSSVDDNQVDPEVIDLENERNSRSQQPNPPSESLKPPSQTNNPPEQKKISNGNTNAVANINSSATHAGNNAKIEYDAAKSALVKRNVGNEMLQANKKVTFPVPASTKNPSVNPSQTSSHDAGHKRKFSHQDASSSMEHKSASGTSSTFKIPMKPSENKKMKM